MNKKSILLIALFVLLFSFGISTNVSAASPVNDGFIDIQIGDDSGGDDTVKLLVIVAILSMAPAILLMFTHFTYVVIVMGMTRQALGTQTIPPNQVLIGLSLFISIYMMFPVIQTVYKEAWVPLEKNQIKTAEALKIAEEPLKKYALDNTYEKDLSMVLKIRGDEKPKSYEEVSVFAAVPAFVLTQIQKGLFTGMMIYWTFAFIDMIVSALLMYMGMMMLPPMILSLPFKILIFLYLGGFTRITEIIFSAVNL